MWRIVERLFHPNRGGFVRVDEKRMYFFVRKDLGLTGGKIAAQCSHAAYELGRTLPRLVVDESTYWTTSKIVLYVDDLDHLHRIEKLCYDNGIRTSTIVDGGRTQVVPDTVTVMGAGPLSIEDGKRLFADLDLVP